MRYSIVYSTRTGNTKLLADTIREALPAEDCVYFGEPDAAALAADRIYVGFWTDRGSCDANTEKFLKTLTDQQVFLFGSAGFGGSDAYYQKILERTRECLPEGVTEAGSFMCQGKMPMSVRERYVKMGKGPVPNVQNLIENFDRALSHPDAEDLEHLRSAVLGK